MSDLLNDKAKLLDELKKWVHEVMPVKSNSKQIPEDESLTVSLDDKLILAVMMNHEADICRLLDIGANPKAQSKSGLDALQIALIHNRKDMAQLLEEYQKLTATPSKKPKA